MLCLDFTLLRRYIGLPCFFSPTPPYIEAHVQYDLALSSCTIRSGAVSCAMWPFQRFLYDINLGATHTTILSIRGVTIPIYLVSSTMDSIR